MVEAHEIAEKIQGEHEHEHARHSDRAREWLRRATGIYLGIVAMLLAISTLGGAEATKTMLNANIHATDTYAFYQAKYQRQTMLELSAAQLELLAGGTALSGEGAGKAAALIKRYHDTATRYESDPSAGNGKKELLEKAKDWEAIRDHAEEQIPNFEYGEAMYQIAIVLGSVAIIASSPWILGFSGVLAVLGTLLTINGYFLLVPLAAH
ncbi:MAG TPA: DUF4337 domain-containing protein [Stellaceae bacterium]|nr:DUF4337 domain-containing protein [Stellaceae bacterium]